MKKYVLVGLVAVMLTAISLSYGVVAFAKAWEIFVSNHRFVINGEEVEVSALTINGRNYVSIAEFTELFGIDIYYDDTTGTVYMDSNIVSQDRKRDEELAVTPNRYESSRPETARTQDTINWDVDFSHIFDGEIFDGSAIDDVWLDRFRVNGSITTNQSTWVNSVITRGIIMSGNQVIILNNGQYIILDDLETISRVTSAMNFSFDETAIGLARQGRLVDWDWIEVYFPFVSNETIEKIIEIYNFERPAS